MTKRVLTQLHKVKGKKRKKNDGHDYTWVWETPSQKTSRYSVLLVGASLCYLCYSRPPFTCIQRRKFPCLTVTPGKTLGMGNSVSENVKIFCASAGCLIITGLSMTIPLSMIVMGSLYLNKCPAERYIPIYFIVFGLFTVLTTTLRFMMDCCSSENSKASVAMVIIYVITFITGPFVFAWFVAGNVWIYRLNNNYSPEPGAANYCDQTFYLYAFWITTSLYILSAVVLVVMCLGLIVVLFRKLAN